MLAQAVELAEARQPFVLASVVWRRGPSSGQQGAKAIILADGTVRGWMGGACAQPSVVREALACLEDGDAVMVTYNPAAAGERPVIDHARRAGKGVLIKKGFASGHLAKLGEADPVDAAVRFVFGAPGVTCLVAGTIAPDHLAENARAVSRHAG